MQSVPTITRRAATTLAAALLLLPTGCSAGAERGSPPRVAADQDAEQADRHNEADIAFAQAMIEHHRQAVDMAALAETRGGNAEVKALAGQIKQVQAAEMGQLGGWLTEWNAPLPPLSPSEHGGHSGAPGIIAEEHLTGLQEASGDEFDRTFLEMMINHYEGALQIAVVEQREGRHPGAKELATRIVKAQRDEIEQLRRVRTG